MTTMTRSRCAVRRALLPSHFPAATSACGRASMLVSMARPRRTQGSQLHGEEMAAKAARPLNSPAIPYLSPPRPPLARRSTRRVLRPTAFRRVRPRRSARRPLLGVTAGRAREGRDRPSMTARNSSSSSSLSLSSTASPASLLRLRSWRCSASASARNRFSAALSFATSTPSSCVRVRGAPFRGASERTGKRGASRIATVVATTLRRATPPPRHVFPPLCATRPLRARAPRRGSRSSRA